MDLPRSISVVQNQCDALAEENECAIEEEEPSTSVGRESKDEKKCVAKKIKREVIDEQHHIDNATIDVLEKLSEHE